MIKSFGDKETEKIWKGIRSKKLPNEIQEIARRKLRMLNNSENIIDLRIPPSNSLEKLGGRLKEFYSIRINLSNPTHRHILPIAHIFLFEARKIL